MTQEPSSTCLICDKEGVSVYDLWNHLWKAHGIKKVGAGMGGRSGLVGKTNLRPENLKRGRSKK